MRKIIYFESLIQWGKYFKTLKINTVITNFIIPLAIVTLFYFSNKEKIIIVDTYQSFYVGILTVSTLIIGFSYSMIVSLITSNGENTDRLKSEKLDKRNISLFEAMLHKFYFVIINLIIVTIMSILFLIISLNNFLVLCIIVFLMISSLLILTEGLTNLVSVFKK